MANQNSQFFAILTNVGVAKQANADALGVAWKLTHMAVGDANDTDPIPSAAQTKLINEKRRAPLNQLKVDPANNAIIIAEQVIPAEVGGWWIREIGLYDADGDLVAVANCAPSYKPLLTQGSGRTQVVRINLQVSNSSNVELKIDPSVVLATRKYVDDSIINVLPADKTAGTYTKVVVNSRGVVVSGSNPSSLEGNGITDAYTKAQVDAIIAQASALPVGATVFFQNSAVPPGFLELDGSVQSSATYPDLSAFYAGKYNTGNEGVGNFRLPDMRGEFPRGWDHGRGVDAGRALGSAQKGTAVAFDDATAIYINGMRSNSVADDKLSTFEADAATLADYPKAIVGGASATNVTAASMVGATRPRNVAVMWCVKAWNAPINQGNIDVASLAAQVQKLALNGPAVGSVRNGKMALSAASASATYTADEVIVSTAVGAPVFKVSGLNKVINLATVGAGGMDVGAAPVSGFVALYAIYNPDTNVSALLARNTTSIFAETVYSGGKMPAGYTASALLTVLPTDATGLIKAVTVEDRKVSMPLALSYSLSGVVANNTPVVLGSIPLNARSVKGEISMSNSAASGMSCGLSGLGGAGQQVASFSVPASGGIVSNYGDVPLSVAQTVYVSVTNQSGSPSYALYVGGYTI